MAGASAPIKRHGSETISNRLRASFRNSRCRRAAYWTARNSSNNARLPGFRNMCVRMYRNLLPRLTYFPAARSYSSLIGPFHVELLKINARGSTANSQSIGNAPSTAPAASRSAFRIRRQITICRGRKRLIPAKARPSGANVSLVLMASESRRPAAKYHLPDFRSSSARQRHSTAIVANKVASG